MSERNIQGLIGIFVIIFIAIVILVTLFAGFIIDFLWFNSLQYSGIFWKILSAKFFIVFLFSLFGGLLLGASFWFAYRFAKKEGVPLWSENSAVNFDFGEYSAPLKQLTAGSAKRLHWLLILAPVILGLLNGLAMLPHWESFLKFFDQTAFGKTDPVFGKDVAFYVFSIPVYRLFKSWLMSMIVLSFLGSAVIYWLNGMFTVQGRSILFSRTVKLHLYSLVILGLLMKVWDYRLQMYELLYSSQGLVFGAGFTDYYVHRFALWGLLWYMLALIALTVFGLVSSHERPLWLILGLVLIIPISIVIQGVVPGLVQQAIVKPNELIKEIPFIEHNIDMTNEAYDLSNIRVKSFAAESSLSMEELGKNGETLDNIRLWDSRPLLSTYQQIQSIRTYYTFYDVDVDRYEIEGKMRQVMLAPRELERERLSERAQTWVNTRLTFTHGYGLVMNPVNSVTDEGLPELLIKDIPPASPVDIPLENTAIYYGEQRVLRSQPASSNAPAMRSKVSDKDDYVIVNTENPEFDYPAGDHNEYVSYEGRGGIRIGSLFRRMLFAWGFRDMNILLTGSTTKESRVIFRRNIQERIKHLAPFLALDSDPYIVLYEGRLYWIQDAYTMTDRYPYAEPVRVRGGQLNYIRNSFKVVVDAYHGNVDFYLMDAQEPLGKTYQKIFPSMFKDFEQMPAGLKAHIRYPKDLFKIQVQMYNTYHMRDPKVFYNKEDLWTVPNEKYGGETLQVEPYYIQMRLPGEDTLEFILMSPFTPKKKDNMIAWLAARCDGENYGELLVYTFPKEKLVYGPSQVEARIDQNTTISQQLSLWDQRGSSVIRGNLIVIPIEDSILYVEPVYLKAEHRDLPELKRVIASYGGEVAMGLGLEQALEAVFGTSLRPEEQRVLERVPALDVEQSELSPIIGELAEHFTRAREYLAGGDWVKYGEEMDQAERIIHMIRQEYVPEQ
ncbi:hypothetical protein CSB45_09250 [candidate division KSB3 bacterium]|uniref:UPF0182 protein CSB45_09250 n=1 Tax=candidate division KSB3 bacterium TaxID=2044937 RepID=A0A2G6E453_9BACT|nr:MAG: hypothetical protein CSB45_09250 [candidate division KSB3 bacterium]PIE29485.1 MAG: hypothetical protein CSA57_08825 [candidate division KSB3 bacterium]